MATAGRVECTIKGDEWTVIFNTGPKDKCTTFKLGQEFEDETPDGRKVKVSAKHIHSFFFFLKVVLYDKHYYGMFPQVLVDLIDGKLVGKERWEDKEVVMTHQLLDDDHWLTVIDIQFAYS